MSQDCPDLENNKAQLKKIIFKQALQEKWLFGAIFEVNSSIGKLWDLLGHFDEKDMIDLNNYCFLFNNSIV